MVDFRLEVYFGERMTIYSSASVVKTIHEPSSPALTMIEPLSPSDAPRTGARCPVWVRSRAPLRPSHVCSVLSADAEMRR